MNELGAADPLTGFRAAQQLAYACADDLICADADGRTMRSEPVSSSRNPCHICASGAP